LVNQKNIINHTARDFFGINWQHALQQNLSMSKCKSQCISKKEKGDMREYMILVLATVLCQCMWNMQQHWR
jgi:hypothetical protein